MEAAIEGQATEATKNQEIVNNKVDEDIAIDRKDDNESSEKENACKGDDCRDSNEILDKVAQAVPDPEIINNKISEDVTVEMKDGNESLKEDMDDNFQDANEIEVPKNNEIVNEVLPPIEDLKITVPEDECQEIGVVTSIVDALVVVESYKGTAPLDIDSILFLDKGKRPLGKIFDVIGPVAEPVYTIRFTNTEQIKSNNIEKGMKVYCAPKTEHSSYVFLPDLLKMKGSDASWEDNMEPPPECQDFSDDEEEQKHKSVVRNVRNENNRRRNPDSTNQDCQKRTKTLNNYNARPPGKYISQSRFKNPHFQRPVNKFTPGAAWSYQPHASSSQQPQSNSSFTPFSGPNPFVTALPSPYHNNPPPFGNFRFPNIPPFPPGNFVPVPPPPPPPPPTSSVQTTHMSYPTRTTGPPPFSSFMTPPPTNRMPIPPFPFSQGFTQQQRLYSQPFQFNARPPPPPPQPPGSAFGPDSQGPPQV